MTDTTPQVDATQATCVQCGLTNTFIDPETPLCAHHIFSSAAEHDGLTWGQSNRALCDFIHRKIVPGQSD